MTEFNTLSAVTVDRFNCKWSLDKTGCHVWATGSRGRFWLQGRNVMATHVSFWFIAHTCWPSFQLNHRCDKPACVNVDHLFDGTQAENVADMVSKGRSFQQLKTHCPKGHEYSADNTYIDGNTRRCRICRRERAARRGRTQRRRDYMRNYYLQKRNSSGT